MQKKKISVGLVAGILFLLILSSCGDYQKLLRSDDYEKKYEKAIEYYYEEEYNRTIRLLQDIIPIYRGTQKAEKIQYYFTMAHYNQRDYLLASHYFQSFVSSYPRSEFTEEFMYLAAYCKYLQSPRPSLDQTITKEAIQDFQRFINRYPQSEKVAEANELIDELRFKLEKKRFEIAMLYYHINDFVAAVTTFNNLLIDYPGTSLEEDALFYIVKSYHDYASLSIAQRQPERYQKTIDAYNRLIRNYPDTKFSREAQRLFGNAREYLDSLHKDEANITITEIN